MKTVEPENYADFARSLLDDPQALAEERARLSQPVDPPPRPGRFGVTVVVPTFGGHDRIIACLDSLALQSLARELFEVIVIANGPDDGTTKAIDAARSTTLRHVDVRVVRTDRPGAGRARNIGLLAAKYDYITFVDDDDRVTPHFLEALLDQATPRTIALAQLRSVDTEGRPVEQSALEARIDALPAEVPTALNQFPWVLGFNACKLVHRDLLRDARYQTHLRSGEDVAFFAHLLQHADVKVARAAESPGAAYLRTVRPGSVSRRVGSFDFDVVQRLAVIAELEKLSLTDKAAVQARSQLVRAQAGFVSRYLEQMPDRLSDVKAAVHESGVSSFPWGMLQRGPARELVICYCFAPYMDTSAVVATKIVADRARMVDVISNDMAKVRSADPRLWGIAAEWVDEFHELSVPVAFNDWRRIAQFGTEALAEAEKMHARRGGYESLYSRALWVGSHVAALLFKSRHWPVRWSAEFSDPLRTGVDGSPRAGEIVPDDVSATLLSAIERRGYSTSGVSTLFDLVEFATYAVADELIFTNVNQRDTMLDAVPDRKLRAAAHAKSTVRPHPAPPPHAYKLATSSVELPSDKTNIGYFGAFYPNRGIDEVFVGLANLGGDLRRRVRVHVFSNAKDAVTERVAELGLTSNVHSRNYVPYAEFLDLSRQFDALVVSDVQTENGSRNVFLPSKISDYRGAGVPVWALVEAGSALDGQQVAYKSELGNSASAARVLRRIVLEAQGTRS